MTVTLNEEIALAFALPLIVVVTQAIYSAGRRVRSYAKVQCVERIVAMMLCKEEPSDREMRTLRMLFPLGTIVDAVNFISENTYGATLHRLSLIAEVCRLECSPLRNTPLGDTATFMEAYPDHAIRYIARIDTPLSWHEVALLSQIMRRRGAPIAYTPLLMSQNRNLQLIGLYLCQHFSIVDAEPHLQRLVGEAESDIAYTALLSLCAIRGNISTRQVGALLANLPPHHRAAFIRHAVQACYSARSCARHLSREENRLFAQRINSYKCQIVCN